MNPAQISIKNYTYILPENKIAKYPLSDRDASKLLIYKQGNISEDIFANLSDHIPETSLLVFNNTRVIEARILFQKSTGGLIEIFCLEPHKEYTDTTTAMLQQEKARWHCLIGGASKWKPGQILQKKIKNVNQEITLIAKFIEKRTDHFTIELSWTPVELSFAAILHAAGTVPLPPYIKREIEQTDAERYQTLYACHDGSVAAPTAGLHFTQRLFKKLETKSISREFVTLHVGAGTFKPVKSETLGQHEMHVEFICVSKQTIHRLIKSLDQIIAVGTTSLRTLETLYWLGVKIKVNPSIKLNDLHLSQWESYELENHRIDPGYALQLLIGWLNNNKLEQLFTKTQLLIIPGYKAKIPKALITNFHQPQSTLLLLVAALIGDDWKKIYEYAMQHEYRFLSYGDGSILWLPQPLEKGL